MPSRRLITRLLLGGWALALLAPATASAQDGQPEVGPPVTAPETNKDNPANPVDAARPPQAPSPEEVLPGVPASASDPAPFGTRSVRVDLPRNGAAPAADPELPPARGATGPIVDPAARPGVGGRRVPNVFYAEGMVTRATRPGTARDGSLMHILVDTSQDWTDYLNGGARPIAAPLNRSTDRARAAAADADRAAVDAQAIARTRPADPAVARAAAADAAIVAARARQAAAAATAVASAPNNLLDLTVLPGSRVWAFRRTADGLDLYGAENLAAARPEITPDGTVVRREAARPAMPEPTTWGNVKPGSFVAVRYRRGAAGNEVLNLSLIELPTGSPLPAAAGAPGVVGAPANDLVPGERPRVVGGRPGNAARTNAETARPAVPEGTGSDIETPPPGTVTTPTGRPVQTVPTENGGGANALPR